MANVPNPEFQNQGAGSYWMESSYTMHSGQQMRLGHPTVMSFAPARVYGGWRMVLDSLGIRQIWPPHIRAAAGFRVSEAPLQSAND
jgi:hypothetical protein